MRIALEKLFSLRYKKINLIYYPQEYIKLFLRPSYSPKALKKRLQRLQNNYNSTYINNRVDYYNKLNTDCILPDTVRPLREFTLQSKCKTYYLDSLPFKRFFNPDFKFNYLFGDITEIPPIPSIVKSRPIGNQNTNSVLLNLNKIRHFIFVKDSKCFTNKKNVLLWRGNLWDYQPQRVQFFEKHFNNPICNIGQVNTNNLNSDWIKEKLSIFNQLDYKFILSLEGNDVASNLKWIMSSNSIAVMPKPKYETWFMEGTLIPDHHYIEINNDYSNVDEKINYYIENPDKAQAIIKNANAYCNQFQDKKREKLISLLVLKKYFERTNKL
jgi:hypothetical protein